jgi:acyl-CoA reductase-like NAD-dependent aldehyde dehydrogenase
MTHEHAIAPGDIVNQARDASRSWSSIPVHRRIPLLRSLRHAIVNQLDSLVDAIRKDTGKVRTEALLTDMLPTLEQLQYNERHASRVLAPDPRAGSILFRGARARVEYDPWGVVLTVCPWNNPLQLTLVPVATALAAGNAVVLKPSERTPATASAIRSLFEESGLGAPLVHVVEGGPELTVSLLESDPDFIFFTGGTRAGREVYLAAASRLIPVLLELGSKDPMIVFGDADLARASDAAVYGAFAHDGQHCVSVSRLLVEASIETSFSQAVAERASRLVRGRDLADMLDPSMTGRIQGLVASAIDRGARLLTPRRDGRPVLPAVLSAVTPDMKVVREETFGPVLPVLPFRNEDEAVALARSADHGLSASVWTRDPERARRLASELRTGGVCINNVLVNAGHPALPFGGVGSSGFGRYHGPEGLRAFVRPRAVMDQASASPREMHWFPYDEELPGMLEELIRLRYGGEGHGPSGWWRWLRLEGCRRPRMMRKDLP